MCVQEAHRSRSMHYALKLEASEEVAKASLDDVSTLQPREEEGGKRAPAPPGQGQGHPPPCHKGACP